MRMSDDEFEALIDQALELIPASLLERVENCVLVIEDWPTPDEGDIVGYYDGIPLSERDSQYGGVLPDRVVIFKGPLLSACDSSDEIIDQVRITVWHEIAHYFGIEDDSLDAWGYA